MITLSSSRKKYANRRINRVFSYDRKDIKDIMLTHFLLNNDEGLPEHFVADVKFVTNIVNGKPREKIDIYIR